MDKNIDKIPGENIGQPEEGGNSRTETLGNKVLEEYKARGRLELAELEDAERKEFLRYYTQNFSKIEPETRLELFEQFLSLKDIGEEKAIELASGMSEEDLGTLGEYIGKALDPASYPRLFHKAWIYIHRPVAEEFKEKFTREHPEGALKVAPFIDIASYALKDEDSPDEGYEFKRSLAYTSNSRRPGYPKRDFVKLLDTEFGDSEKASRLMEACVDFPQYRGVESLVQYYRDKQPEFLFPYLPDLVEKGILKEEEAHNILLMKEKEFYYPSVEFYKTEEERGKQDNILEQIKKHNPETEKEDHITNPYYYQRTPRKLIREFEEVQSNAAKRIAEHALGSFEDYKQLLSEQERMEFLSKYSKILPLFYIIDKIELSTEEVDSLVLGAKEEGVLVNLGSFEDVEKLISMGYEEEVLEFFSSYGYDFLQSSRAYELLSIFSQEGRREAVKEINQKFPQVWLGDIERAVEEGYVDFSTIMQRVAMDRSLFLHNYYSMLRTASLYEKSGEEEFWTKDKIKTVARTIFKEEPELFLRHFNVFSELYSQQEREQLIKDSIERDAGSVLQEFFNMISRQQSRDGEDFRRSPWFKACGEIIQKIIEEDPKAVLDGVASGRHSLSWGALKNILGSQKALSFVLKNMDKINSPVNLIGVRGLLSRDFFAELATSADKTNSFVSKLLKSGDAGAMSRVMLTIYDLLAENELLKIPSKKKSVVYGGLELSDAQGRNILRAFEELSPVVKEQSIKDDDVLFSSSVLQLRNELELNEYIEERAPQYLHYFPGILDRLASYASEEQLEKSVLENIKPAAFVLSGSKLLRARTKKLSSSASEKLEAANPILALKKREELDKDYYESAMELAADSPFFNMFRVKLEKIAKKEKKTHGPQKNAHEHYTNSEFDRIIEKIFILESSEVPLPAETIAQMPQKTASDLLDVLELVIFYNLDKDNRQFEDAVKHIEKDLGEASDMLYSILEEYWKISTGIPELKLAGPGVQRAEPASLKAFLGYFFQSAQGDKKARDSFRELFPKVLREDFEQWRAWGEEPDKEKALLDLKEKGLIPESITPEQYSAWVEDDRAQLEEFLEFNVEDLQKGISEILEQAIANRHIEKDAFAQNYEEARDEYDSLLLPVSELSEKLKHLKEKLAKAKEQGGGLSEEEEAEYKELQKEIGMYMKENRDSIDIAEARMYIEKLMNITAKELSTQALNIKNKEKKFTNVFEKISGAFGDDYSEFSQDIRRMQEYISYVFDKMYGGERVSKNSLYISDSVDLDVYIRIGEEPVPTCQSYNSTGNLNLGLMSYVVDPNIKIIQVHDESGALIARSILHLLGDEEGEARLFMEDVYSVNPHKKIKNAMSRFALHKAKKLETTLHSYFMEGVESGGQNLEPLKLHNKASRNSHVYTDAGGGLHAGGEYYIHTAF